MSSAGDLERMTQALQKEKEVALAYVAAEAKNARQSMPGSQLTTFFVSLPTRRRWVVSVLPALPMFLLIARRSSQTWFSSMKQNRIPTLFGMWAYLWIHLQLMRIRGLLVGWATRILSFPPMVKMVPLLSRSPFLPKPVFLSFRCELSAPLL
ncbi:hypothetical protein LIER_11720 [Lithospermum erythrorhizon]|uniref:Uncharacterized protein n=1 Tax=Lithospermum erythrorhizon TaxID=34254 RepID=A0AAV3PRE5_LITER